MKAIKLNVHFKVTIASNNSIFNSYQHYTIFFKIFKKSAFQALVGLSFSYFSTNLRLKCS